MVKLTSSDVRIERLTENHDVSSICSYEKDLIDFLTEDALSNQDKKISVTYLWFLKETDELVGYISVLNDRINLEGDLKIHFKDKGIRYSSLPALKIGRLCVDDKFLRRGIGTLMMSFAVQIANSIYEKHSGCRFIVLDAKRNNNPEKDSIHFYKPMGFKTLKERKKGTTPMYYDLLTN